MKRSQSRVSLTEVLTLLMILGLTAFIAKPHFESFQARARRSEAFASLTAIHASEATYFAAHKSYTYCLYEAGYTPSLPERFYLTGFTSNTERVDACDAPPISFGETFRTAGMFIMNRWANTDLTWQGITGDFRPQPTSYRAVAFGSIASDSGLFDVWSIDEKKRLIQEQDGL